MRVSVIGLGLIGGSIGLEMKATGFAKQVIGVDQNPDHCRMAIDLGLVDEIWTLGEAASKSDLIILSIPVNSIAQLLPEILNQMQSQATITDMGSTKVDIIKSVATHAKRSQYVPSHPMAGTEYSGPAAAFRGLFVGRTAVICDPDKSNPENLKVVENLYQALKMRLVYMNSVDHDVHTAFVSHLSHITSFVLANTVLDLEKNDGKVFDLAGGGFESTVRLAKSSPQMWLPILQQNKKNIIAALDTYIEHMETFRQTLLTDNQSKTLSLIQQANQIRRVLENIQRPKKTDGTRT